MFNSPKEKTNLFNGYFESQTLLDDYGKKVPPLDLPVHILDAIHLNANEVCSILKTLPLGKACGPDSINNRIMKETAESISEPLTNLFNKSLETSRVPDILSRKRNLTLFALSLLVKYKS